MFFHSDKSTSKLPFDEFAVVVSGVNDVVAMPSREDYNPDEQQDDD